MKAAGLIQLGVLAALLFSMVAAIGVAWVYPHLRRRLGRSAPAERAWWVFALCALPAASAVGLTALCFLPSVLDSLWPGFDHCPQHGGRHPHLCLVHLPLAPGSVAGWIVATTLAAVLALRLLHRMVRTARSRGALRQLARSALFDRERGAWIVESEVPLAMTSGLFRCRTFVSSALLASLPPALVDAVIAHEKAHARRRDVLLKLLASLLSVAHLPRARGALLADLDLAVEQASDEAAGASLGDRLRVARALVALERLLQSTQARYGFAGVSFGGSKPSSRTPRRRSRLARRGAG